MKVKYQDALLYKIIRPIITYIFKILYKPLIIGNENIPTNGKVILAGNHTHILDSLLLMSSTKRNIHFLAKKELWQMPKKIIFKNLGLIPVDRQIHDHTALVHAEAYLNANLVVGIFPEGTISKKNQLLDFKIGAIKMASDTNTSIVPFVIKGKYKILSPNIQIKFLKSIVINQEKNLEHQNKILRDIIKNELGEK